MRWDVFTFTQTRYHTAQTDVKLSRAFPALLRFIKRTASRIQLATFCKIRQGKETVRWVFTVTSQVENCTCLISSRLALLKYQTDPSVGPPLDSFHSPAVVGYIREGWKSVRTCQRRVWAVEQRWGRSRSCFWTWNVIKCLCLLPPFLNRSQMWMSLVTWSSLCWAARVEPTLIFSNLKPSSSSGQIFRYQPQKGKTASVLFVEGRRKSSSVNVKVVRWLWVACTVDMHFENIYVCMRGPWKNHNTDQTSFRLNLDFFSWKRLILLISVTSISPSSEIMCTFNINLNECLLFYLFYKLKGRVDFSGAVDLFVHIYDFLYWSHHLSVFVWLRSIWTCVLRWSSIPPAFPTHGALVPLETTPSSPTTH